MSDISQKPSNVVPFGALREGGPALRRAAHGPNAVFTGVNLPHRELLRHESGPSSHRRSGGRLRRGCTRSNGKSVTISTIRAGLHNLIVGLPHELHRRGRIIYGYKSLTRTNYSLRSNLVQ
jgi:hypothetical protein